MTVYIVRRLITSIMVLFIVMTIVFFAMRVLPGDPAIAMLGSHASNEALDRLREKFGLNVPVYVQYFRFLKGMAKGDLGESMILGKPVAELFVKMLPYSAELAFAGIVIGVILGLPLGILAALKRNQATDYFLRTIAMFGISIPAFFMGIILLLVFAFWIPIFPTMGGGNLKSIGSNLYHLFLPALSKGLLFASVLSRLVRSKLLEVMNQDYVRTARSKGIPEYVVVLKHGIRNTLIEISTVIGLNFATMIGGLILTEVVFTRPGLGKLLIGAIMDRDYNLVQSGIMFFAALVIFVNLLVDVTYSFIDPRVKYD